MPLIWTLSVFCTLVTALLNTKLGTGASPVPALGHRAMGTGAWDNVLSRTPIFEYNTNATPGRAVAVPIVSAGDFYRVVTSSIIDCRSGNTSSAPKGRQQALPIGYPPNSPPDEFRELEVLSCAEDHCTGQGPARYQYTHCKGRIANNHNATILLDPGVHFILFVDVNDQTFEIECWPKIYGFWPEHLTLSNTQANMTQACLAPTPKPPVPIPKGPTYALGMLSSPYRVQVKNWMLVPNVSSVGFSFDGHMDRCGSYRRYNMTTNHQQGGGCDDIPNVTAMPDSNLQRMATKIASTACAYDEVGEVQINLSPFRGYFKPGIVRLVGFVAKALREERCASPAWPYGRSVSLLVHAEEIEGSGLLETAGQNLLIILRGFDLYPDDDDDGDSFRYNTVEEYGRKLKTQVEKFREISDGFNTTWSLAVPAAASYHEYETYRPDDCTPSVCTPFTNTATQDEYVRAALGLMQSMPEVFNMDDSSSLFRGVTVWKFSSSDLPPWTAFPVGSWNLFRPVSATNASLQLMAKGLPTPTAQRK